jgi:glycosyltransferase involved in cell wall biosynthesis
MVDIYIALTDFARNKFIQGGLPAGKIVVKPNFIDPDPGTGNGQGGYAIFAARLTPEKGIDTLLSAWEKIGRKIQLKIIGDGPLNSQVYEASRHILGVEWLCYKPRQFILNLMKNAVVLIFPSVCYENFGLTISEAFSVGLPVIASKLGVMSSMIEHKRTGLHFQPGDPEDLAKKMNWIISHPAELKRMRKAARAEYESKYTAELNYKRLIDIYETAKLRSRK